MYSSSSPSTSSSSPNTLKVMSEKCVICYQPAHGNHFGVDCCRACAAFFRRIFVTHKQHFKCATGLNHCSPDVRGRWSCKKCRTDKCFELGMRPDNIQYDRDLFSCSQDFSKQAFAKSLRKIPSTSAPQYITYFDFSPLLESVEKILSDKTPKCVPYRCQTPLQRLAFGLKEIRRSQLWDNIPAAKCIGKNETYDFWKTEMERTATWLMYLDDFRDLKIDDKMTILKCMWFLFARLERSAMTAQLRMGEKCEKSDYAFRTDFIVNAETVKFDFDWLSHFSSEQMRTFLGNPSIMLCEGLTTCMMKIQPTDEELCYVLCHLCFDHLGKKLSGPMQESMERLQKVFSDNLHDYYVEQDQMSRYSHRLARILKISQCYRTLMEKKRRLNFLGKVFDAFRVKYSHPDLFQYQSFE